MRNLFKIILFFISYLLVFFNFTALAIDSLNQNDEFESYKKEFDSYKKQINDEFGRYVELVNKEFNSFKKEIYKEWGDQLISDKVRWVEYSSDMKIRSIVDFEQNKMIVQVKAGSSEVGKKIAEEHVKKILDKTIADAFKSSKPLVNIEKKAKEEFNASLSTALPDIKVIGVKSDKEVDQILKNGLVKTETNKKGETITSLTISFKISDRDKALKYKDIVDNYAKLYNIPSSLIYAIIHTESYFNPMATSPAPAYGLMQIMPSNAGKDAAKVLFGSPLILLPSFLYNPDNNVKVGSTYFNLLKESYTREIKNEKSRLYIAIVGYNVGLRNVYRVFSSDGDPRKAFYEINRLSSEEVYAKITKNLSQKEGVTYLMRVLERMKFYSDI